MTPVVQWFRVVPKWISEPPERKGSSGDTVVPVLKGTTHRNHPLKGETTTESVPVVRNHPQVGLVQLHPTMPAHVRVGADG